MIQWFKMLKIANKLWMLVMMFFAVFIASNLFDLAAAKQKLLEEKSLKTRHLVESAYSVVKHYAELEKSGTMSRDDAQNAAKAAVRSMRYEEVEYFWINDLGRPAPKMVMHPTAPALDGKVLDAERFNKATSFAAGADGKFQPLSNKNLFVAFNDVVEQAGHGYVTYDWPKPKAGGGTTTELYPKLSYVKKFDTWGWVIGSGIYIDDLDAAFWAEFKGGLLKFVLLGVLIGLISWLIGRSIIAAIDQTADAMDAVAAGDGDLSKRLTPAAHGSMTRLANSFNNFAAKIDQSIGRVNESTARLAAASTQMSSAAAHTAQGVREQEEETERVAEAVNELAARAQEVETSAVDAADAARQADAEALAGKQVVASTVQAIQRLAANVKDADGVIEELRQESSNIGEIVDVIRGIADQTNLLALNAAIEAARAGEQGRGFAVVADEVRVLAQRTQESTQQIQRKIEALQKGTQKAAKVMAESCDQAETSVTQAGGAGESLAKITQSVATIAEVNEAIVARAKAQAAQAGAINENLGAIRTVSQQTADDAGQMQKSTGELADLLADLQGLVRQFKITASGKFDFDAAIAAHLAWKARLRAFLDGTSTLTREQAVSHRHCVLGKWYYGDGMTHYGHLSVMREIEPPHEELHKVIAQIVESKHKGKRDEAERLFQRIEPLSKKIVGLLENARQQVQKG